MSIISSILAPVHYCSEPREYCSRCGSVYVDYLVDLSFFNHAASWLCFDCFDEMSDTFPGFFDEQFVSGQLVMVPLNYLSRSAEAYLRRLLK